MYIAEDIKYVGVNDHEIDLFEGQYVVPEGMAYNSYVILDEKTAVFDTVGENFVEEWLGNVNNALGEKKADYLIIQHMEPDHSSGIESFMLAHPGDDDRRYGEGLCDDAAIFCQRFHRQTHRCGRGNGISFRQAYAKIYHGAYGALAGGYDDL